MRGPIYEPFVRPATTSARSTLPAGLLRLFLFVALWVFLGLRLYGVRRSAENPRHPTATTTGQPTTTDKKKGWSDEKKKMQKKYILLSSAEAKQLRAREGSDHSFHCYISFR